MYTKEYENWMDDCSYTFSRFRHQVLHVVHFITVYLLAMYLSLFRGTFMSLSLFCCLNLNHTKYTSFKSERPRSEVNIMNGGRRWLKLLYIQVAFYSKISCFTPVYSVISLWFDQIFHILWHTEYHIWSTTFKNALTYKII